MKLPARCDQSCLRARGGDILRLDPHPHQRVSRFDSRKHSGRGAHSSPAAAARPDRAGEPEARGVSDVVSCPNCGRNMIETDRGDAWVEYSCNCGTMRTVLPETKRDILKLFRTA